MAETAFDVLADAGLIDRAATTADDRHLIERLTVEEAAQLVAIAQKIYGPTASAVKLSDLGAGDPRIMIPL